MSNRGKGGKREQASLVHLLRETGKAEATGRRHLMALSEILLKKIPNYF